MNRTFIIITISLLLVYSHLISNVDARTNPREITLSNGKTVTAECGLTCNGYTENPNGTYSYEVPPPETHAFTNSDGSATFTRTTTTVDQTTGESTTHTDTWIQPAQTDNTLGSNSPQAPSPDPANTQTNGSDTTANVGNGGSTTSANNSPPDITNTTPIQTSSSTSGDPSSPDFVGPQAPQKTTTTSDSASNNILGVDGNKLRNGDVNIDTIPLVIVSVIRFLLGVAGALSAAALIYHAVKMQLASGITGDSSGVDKAKAGMKGAIVGFVISILGWFIVTRFMEILSSVSGG